MFVGINCADLNYNCTMENKLDTEQVLAYRICSHWEKRKLCH